MLHIEYSGQFKRDIKLAEKRRKDMNKLKELFNFLVNDINIPKKYKDHALTGNWKNFRELHIEPDWLLIYHKIENIIRFERTGSHSDLFG